MLLCVHLGSKSFEQLITHRWNEGVVKLKDLLSSSRKVIICLDGWSKTNLSASFLGVSACFFDRVNSVMRHIMLKLVQLQHPHTGEVLAEALHQCLEEWKITSKKVLMIVSDSGANMTKAIRLLNEQEMDDEESDEEHNQTDLEENDYHSDDDADDIATGLTGNSMNDEDTVESLEWELLDKSVSVPYPRMACVAHSLQLVVKKAYSHYDSLLSKVRRMVGRIRKSSTAVEMMKERCGKVLVSDNSTRWNSTYHMISRFIELKACVNELLSDMKTDTLLINEWMRLQELCDLLKPFAKQTDKLQTDCQSLSHVIPALMELQCHLQSCAASKSVTKAMLSDMKTRFSCILDPDNDNFNPIPAAACLLNPVVAIAMLMTDMTLLFDAAKKYLFLEVFYVLLLSFTAVEFR